MGLIQIGRHEKDGELDIITTSLEKIVEDVVTEQRALLTEEPLRMAVSFASIRG